MLSDIFSANVLVAFVQAMVCDGMKRNEIG